MGNRSQQPFALPKALTLAVLPPRGFVLEGAATRQAFALCLTAHVWHSRQWTRAVNSAYSCGISTHWNHGWLPAATAPIRFSGA
jgi:hypothetical protein